MKNNNKSNILIIVISIVFLFLVLNFLVIFFAGKYFEKQASSQETSIAYQLQTDVDELACTSKNIDNTNGESISGVYEYQNNLAGDAWNSLDKSTYPSIIDTSYKDDLLVQNDKLKIIDYPTGLCIWDLS